MEHSGEQTGFHGDPLPPKHHFTVLVSAGGRRGQKVKVKILDSAVKLRLSSSWQRPAAADVSLESSLRLWRVYFGLIKGFLFVLLFSDKKKQFLQFSRE